MDVQQGLPKPVSFEQTISFVAARRIATVVVKRFWAQCGEFRSPPHTAGTVGAAIDRRHILRVAHFNDV